MAEIKNIRHLLIICFIVFVNPVVFSTLVAAQDVVSSEEKQIIFEKLHGLTQNIITLTATVNQEKQLRLLKKPVYINGIITLKKPNMFRWDVFKPDKSVIASDGESMTVYHPDIKEAQVYDLVGNPTARHTMNFFVTIMGGAFDEIKKQFLVEILRNKDEIVLKLSPLSKMVGRYLSYIVINYDETTGLPYEFEMNTPKGDKTVTSFSHIKINPEISTEFFKIRLSDDVKITNLPERSHCITE